MGAMTRRFNQGTPEQIQSDARVLRQPYDHYPIPDNAIPFFKTGSVATPAWGIANVIELLSYEVAIGWEGYLMAIMSTITGDAGTYINGSGDVVWSFDIDNPLGNPLASGRYLAGYYQITRTLGDLTKPWPIARELRGWRMRSGETYRGKVYTVANVATGSPSFCHASILGMVWPKC